MLISHLLHSMARDWFYSDTNHSSQRLHEANTINNLVQCYTHDLNAQWHIFVTEQKITEHIHSQDTVNATTRWLTSVLSKINKYNEQTIATTEDNNE